VKARRKFSIHYRVQTVNARPGDDTRRCDRTERPVQFISPVQLKISPVAAVSTGPNTVCSNCRTRTDEQKTPRLAVQRDDRDLAVKHLRIRRHDECRRRGTARRSVWACFRTLLMSCIAPKHTGQNSMPTPGSVVDYIRTHLFSPPG